eukprot:3470447-Pyramimonas_sp.AAC.1
MLGRVVTRGLVDAAQKRPTGLRARWPLSSPLAPGPIASKRFFLLLAPLAGAVGGCCGRCCD